MLRIASEGDAPVFEIGDPIPKDWAEAWVLLDGPHRNVEREGDAVRQDIRWSYMVLEPGERQLVLPEWIPGAGRAEFAGATVTIAPSLAPDEDAPRPPKPLHDVDPPSRSAPGTWRCSPSPPPRSPS